MLCGEVEGRREDIKERKKKVEENNNNNKNNKNFYYLKMDGKQNL